MLILYVIIINNYEGETDKTIEKMFEIDFKMSEYNMIFIKDNENQDYRFHYSYLVKVMKQYVREEHGQIHIFCGKAEWFSGDEINQKTIEQSQQNAGKKVDVKLRCAPVLFQSAADPVIEINGNNSQHTVAWGNHGKTDFQDG